MKPTRTLLRGLAVIEALADHHGGMGLTELAEAAALDKGTASRLLFTLAEAGWVRREEDGRTYRLTTKVLHIAVVVAGQTDLRSLARPHLSRLRDLAQETVHLGVVEDDRVVYVEKLEPSGQTIRLVTAVGQSMPVHSTALGKAILGWMEPTGRDELIARLDLTAQTAKTITDPEALRGELARVVERGYAIDDGENMDTSTCVAAPLLGPDGRPVGAISISSPTFRIAERVPDLGRLVRDTAAAVSVDLGARPERAGAGPERVTPSATHARTRRDASE